MAQDVRYVTDELGERVAVLLDLATYQRLIQILVRVDDLNLLKAKARYTLEYHSYLYP